MSAVLAVIACLACTSIIYAFTSARRWKRRLQIAFRGADITQRPYDEAWSKHTVVWNIYAAHAPSGNGYKHDIVRLAPKVYSISDPQLVRFIFASAPKTDFYTNNFSHAPLPTIAFEMVHATNAQRRKTQTGGFLRLQQWEWSRFERDASKVCERLCGGLDVERAKSTTVDVYDHVGAACMELGLRAMMGERAPSLVPLSDQGRCLATETSATYDKIGCSQTEAPPPSSLDAWCHQAFLSADKSDEGVPRILQSLRKFSSELGGKDIAGVAAAEVSDDAAASHLCGILTSTLLQRLAEHQDWQTRIHEELADRVATQRSESWLRISVLNSCKTLGAVFWETLRLSPPVSGPQPRAVVGENSQLTDAGVEVGSTVTASAFVVNRSSRFGRNPGSWNPQRWLDASEETAKTWQRLMLSFGSGPRACEGKEIAKFICQAVIADLVAQYHVASELDNMEVSGGFIAHPRARNSSAILPLRLERRD